MGVHLRLKTRIYIFKSQKGKKKLYEEQMATEKLDLRVDSRQVTMRCNEKNLILIKRAAFEIQGRCCSSLFTSHDNNVKDEKWEDNKNAVKKARSFYIASFSFYKTWNTSITVFKFKVYGVCCSLFIILLILKISPRLL